MNGLVNTFTRFLTKNSPTILTVSAIGGVVATAIFAARAGTNAERQAAEHNHNRLMSPDSQYPMTKKEEIQLVWKNYIPAAIVGTATIGCMIGSHRVNTQRLVAATVAYSVADRAFAEYKEKVVEQLGFRKEEKIRDELAQEKVNKNPPPAAEVKKVEGSDKVLCYEAYTGRYFLSDMESLRKAQNDINVLLIHDDFASLSDFYDIVGIRQTTVAYDLGWSSDKLMNLIFSTVLHEGVPCISFEYSYVMPLNGRNYSGFCSAE